MGEGGGGETGGRRGALKAGAESIPVYLISYRPTTRKRPKCAQVPIAELNVVDRVRYYDVRVGMRLLEHGSDGPSKILSTAVNRWSTIKKEEAVPRFSNSITRVRFGEYGAIDIGLPGGGVGQPGLDC